MSTLADAHRCNSFDYLTMRQNVEMTMENGVPRESIASGTGSDYR